MKTAIIVNPSSGGGRSGSKWQMFRDEIHTRLGSLEEFVTTKAGDATRFASQVAHSADTKLLIVAGGDGTINEVINGLFNDNQEPINPELALGILSSGRGCDFIRSVNIPNDFRQGLDLLVNPVFKKIDLGCVFFKDEFGREQKRLFHNVSSAGLAGKVAKTVNHTPKFLPPALAYYGSVATSFLTHEPSFMRISVDDKIVFDGQCLNLFVCNGGFSGAGMSWAPMAKVDDGIFEIVIGEPQPKYRVILSAPKLYDGTFLDLPGVHHYRGKTVTIETRDDVFLELDGEQPGVAPAVFKILPKVLTLAVGPDSIQK